MKLRTVNAIIGLIVLILIFVVWKLNDYYKRERTTSAESQIHQQTLNLKTALSGQLTQLKNTISSYQGKIDESKINWVQLSPFYALVQLDISAQGQYTVKNLFVRSGTPAANWSNDYIQKALSYSRFSNKDIHAQLFQNQQGGKFLSLIFSDEKVRNSRQAVAVIGDAAYFQKYFDALRSGRATNLILTNDAVVVGHTQPDYIATKTREDQLSDKKYFVDKDQIRSSNLSIISYTAKLASREMIFIPLFVLVFVFGFAFILIGLVFYALKPLQSETRKAEIFKKVFEEVRREPQPAAGSPHVTEAADPEPVPQQPVVRSTPPPPPPEATISRMQPVDKAVADRRLEVTIAPVDRADFMINEEGEDTLIEDLQALESEMPGSSVFSGVQTISLAEVVELALQSMNEKISVWKGHIEKHYDSFLTYELDIERFKKAVVNLISNSIEAQAKEIIIKIYDVPGLKKTVTNIDITDDGVGLGFGTADKIWQPFYGTKDKLQHKGLGLSETLSVVRHYGADIKTVPNQLGGTTFRIEMDMAGRGQQIEKIAETPDVQSESPMYEIAEPEIDIDSILNLDDAEDEPVSPEKTTEDEPKKVDLAQEYTTTQYKMDQRIDIIEDPAIHFAKPDKKIDQIVVKVRKPEKI